MKNNALKPVKPPKNKRKILSFIFALPLAFCSILAPFTAFTANADVVDVGDVIEQYVPNDYYRHPLGGFSLSCYDAIDDTIEVFDCPATYGGSTSNFSNRFDFDRFYAWQNTSNGTFHVDCINTTDSMFLDVDSVIFQLTGFNVGLVREHISTNSWYISTNIAYDMYVYAQPILSSGSTAPDLINYKVNPTYLSGSDYRFYWADIFEKMPDSVYAQNGTALFDMIWISFVVPDDVVSLPVFAFVDEGYGDGDIYLSSYAGRINALYNWIYNGSPIETILSFPIDFLQTEIFPNFTFGTMLLIALGVMVFGLGLKIAFGG